MKSIEELIKEVPKSRTRTIAWASENGFITDDNVVDYNEFNIIVSHEGSLWNIRGGGHNWEAIGDLEKRINN